MAPYILGKLLDRCVSLGWFLAQSFQNDVVEIAS
jgi:hypothetical protein